MKGVQLQGRPKVITTRQELHGDKILDDLDQAEARPGDLRHGPLKGRPCTLAPGLALGACEEEGVGLAPIELGPLYVFEADTGHSGPQQKCEHHGIRARTLAQLEDQVHELPGL